LSNFNGKKDTLFEGITCEWDVAGIREKCVCYENVLETTETNVTVFDRTKLKLILVAAVDPLAWKIL